MTGEGMRVHVIVRSLADCLGARGRCRCVVSESNRVLDEVRNRRAGLMPRFDAGLARGEGAAAPAVVTVRDGETDFALPLAPRY